jgi:hypothetical protein
MERYLTKSRFKLALECPTRLYYTGKKEYNNKKLTDPFLLALAEGGFQVGELAKLYFPDGVNIDELDHDIAVEKTNEFLKQESVIIYEAAFRFENLFIRADILKKQKDHIQLIEVKAKSYDPSDKDESFLNTKGFVRPGWAPYLYDVAFQKYVISKSFPGFKVSSYLMLTDKSKTCSVDGLNQKFFLYAEEGRTRVKINEAIKDIGLGDEILIRINVDDIAELIYSGQDSSQPREMSFPDLIKHYASHYNADKKIIEPLSAKCGACEFKASKGEMANGFRSGYHECWAEQAKFEEVDFDRSHILEIWDFRRKNEYIQNGVYFQDQLTRDDLEPKKVKKVNGPGLSRVDRQEMQILKAKNRDQESFLDKANLSAIIEGFQFPLHFIDFETTSVAIPFNKGRRPYEQIAFQYSHHIVQADGSIEHKGQWINTTVGRFPNFDFARELKKELEQDGGTIFRYAAHENTILNAIRNQLLDSSEHDRDSLCKWIQSITKSTKSNTEEWLGERNMVDMRELVLKYYFNPFTNGSNSLKYVLPAVLNTSDFLKHKYSQPIYGKEIKSLNFSDWQWVYMEPDGSVKNPYKNLPKIHEGFENEMLDEYIVDEESGILDGGAAMIAYARMQFTEMADEERKRIIDALYRYCELDTLAMVMIWEAWREWCKI